MQFHRCTAALLLLPALLQAQSRCCSPTEVFASFGADPRFVQAHPDPAPFTYQPLQGKMIAFPTLDGKDGSAFEVKGKDAAGRVVLMFHEWWGLNDYIRREAEELQVELGDVTVLAVDLYDGRVASSAKEAGELVQAVEDDRARSIIRGAIAYAGSGARIATIGWCFGGGWSFQTALMAGERATACVVYYGMPETDPEKLEPLHAPVFGIFAGQDARITPAVVSRFEQAMRKAGKTVTTKSYNAGHGFANPSNPKHDAAATSDARALVLSFLKKHL